MKYIVGVTALIVAAAIAIPAMGAGEKSKVGVEAQPRAKQVDVQPRARVRCRSLGCLNRKLTKLTNQVKVLRRDAFQCERLVDVTQYDGYVFDGGGSVTALDFTEEGGEADVPVVIYVC